MASDHIVVETQPVTTPATVRSPAPAAHRGRGMGMWPLVLLAIAGLGAGGYLLVGKDREKAAEHATGAGHATPADHGEGGSSSGGAMRVQTTRPSRGGMEQTTDQPGTVRAFDFADLFAKVSGYVKVLKVDRGSRVKKGDLLLELYVPELVAAVKQAEAQLDRSKAGVVQAEARVTTATEKINAKLAFEKEAEAKWRAATAWRDYRDKQYIRISELVARNAVEERLKDEAKDEAEKASADVYAAEAGKMTAKAEVAEARAELAQAQADLVGAKAEVEVSQANLAREAALEEYTHIRSPYNGVVTFRGEAVHVGAFIRSADQGATEQILTVARDDLMRTIVPVPDRDVAFVNLGDQAIVRVDALNGREFKGEVSRIADSEDINDRTMRVEVDLPNLKHLLRDGMFGRAQIILEKATTNLTVPSSSVIDRDPSGKGTVQVVRGGKVYRQTIQIGRDTGTTTEIISGLQADSEVLVLPEGTMADGTAVQTDSKQVAEAPKKDEPSHS